MDKALDLLIMMDSIKLKTETDETTEKTTQYWTL